jgi:hypothetical protein
LPSKPETGPPHNVQASGDLAHRAAEAAQQFGEVTSPWAPTERPCIRARWPPSNAAQATRSSTTTAAIAGFCPDSTDFAKETEVFELPDRPGPEPRTRGPVPHGQLSQISPTTMHEEMWQRMRALPGVSLAPTHVPYPEARAVHLAPEFGTGPDDAFIKHSREFANPHPQQDGSLHRLHARPSVHCGHA